MILRVDLVDSHGRWKRPCLQTAHMIRNFVMSERHHLFAVVCQRERHQVQPLVLGGEGDRPAAQLGSCP
jgi:hypothetical protein